MLGGVTAPPPAQRSCWLAASAYPPGRGAHTRRPPSPPDKTAASCIFRRTGVKRADHAAHGRAVGWRQTRGAPTDCNASSGSCRTRSAGGSQGGRSCWPVRCNRWRRARSRTRCSSAVPNGASVGRRGAIGRPDWHDRPCGIQRLAGHEGPGRACRGHPIVALEPVVAISRPRDGSSSRSVCLHLIKGVSKPANPGAAPAGAAGLAAVLP